MFGRYFCCRRGVFSPTCNIFNARVSLHCPLHDEKIKERRDAKTRVRREDGCGVRGSVSGRTPGHPATVRHRVGGAVFHDTIVHESPRRQQCRARCALPEQLVKMETLFRSGLKRSIRVCHTVS